MSLDANHPPIACVLGALSVEERKRQKELLGTVRGRIQETVELPDGYALRLPADQAMFLEAAEWAALERRCCAFAAFALEWGADNRIWIRVTGKEGAKDVLAAEMGIGASR